MEEPARLIKHVIGLPWCFDVNYRPGKKKHLLLNVVGLQAPWTGWRPSRLWLSYIAVRCQEGSTEEEVS